MVMAWLMQTLIFYFSIVTVCRPHYWSSLLFTVVSLVALCSHFDLHFFFIWKLCRHTKEDRPTDVSIYITRSFRCCGQNAKANRIGSGRQRKLWSVSWIDSCIRTKFKSAHASHSQSATLCLSIVISNIWLGIPKLFASLLSFSVDFNNLLSNDMNILGRRCRAVWLKSF